MKCRSMAEFVLPAVALLLWAHSPGVAAEPPPPSFDVRANAGDLKGGQDAPKEYVDPQQDLKGGQNAPREYIDPLRNQTDVLGGNEAPREYVDPLRNNTDVIGGKEVPRQYDLNDHLPARRNPTPTPSPSAAPRATPKPATPPAYLPPPIRPQPLGQATPRRPQPEGNLIWRGPRYTNAYGTWSPPRVTANYGTGTGRSGPDGQRLNVVSPGYGSSSGGYASTPPSPDGYSSPPPTYGSPKPTYSFGYDDNAPKSLAPTFQPAKGVLMRLGIDPSTYQSDNVPDSLLDRIRLGS